MSVIDGHAHVRCRARPAVVREGSHELVAMRRVRRWLPPRLPREDLSIERTKTGHELAERVGELRDVAPIEPLHAWV